MNTTVEPCSLDLRAVDVIVDRHEVLRKINLNVLPGELFVLLGSAGAGKSTLLRTVAGLETPSGGQIWIDDQDVTALSANRRRVPLLLQSFPLWPHLPVGANVAFGLRARQMARRATRQRVMQALAFVGLTDYYHHRPWQLNRSQQQRAALARTLFAAGRIALLDEPFSAQDAQLREHLLRALKRNQQQSAQTMVISSQEGREALRMADRIAVIHEGEIQQVGPPTELYDAPRTRQVAEYLGDANLIDGEVEYAGDQPLFHADNGLVIPLFDHALRRARLGCAMFRPHDLHLVGRNEAPFGDQIRLSGRIEQAEFLGDRMRYGIDLAGNTVWMDLPRGQTQPQVHIGDQVEVALDPADIRILER